MDMSLRIITFGLFVLICSSVPPHSAPAAEGDGVGIQATAFSHGPLLGKKPSAGCDHKVCHDHCRCICCEHRHGLFVEALFLQASGVDMAYAVPQNGLGAPGTVPTGQVGVASPTYKPGFRVGGMFALDECTSVSATFSWYESKVNNAITTSGANVLNPLVIFPGTLNAGATAQSANARYEIDFRLADLDYRVRFFDRPGCALNYVLGFRYAHLDQDFEAIYPFGPPDGTTTNTTSIGFDGYGLRFGLEGERHVHSCTPLRIYAKGYASILSGQFRASYTQVNQFNGQEALVLWKDERFISILETEIGLAWRSGCGHWQLSAGYHMAVWVNTVSTPVWVQAVQGNNFVNVDDTITFDGLVARLEFLW